MKTLQPRGPRKALALTLVMMGGCGAPDPGCEMGVQPRVLFSDSTRLLKHWILEDRGVFESPSLPTSPALHAFRNEISSRFDVDPMALLQTQLRHVEGGDRENVQAVLEGRVGAIRPVRCLEALLLAVQAERTVSQGASMAERPTEFAAWVLEREGLLKVWYFTVDQPGLGSLGLLHGPVMADLEEGWRVRQHLHNHNFFPDQDGVLGGVVPSTSDVDAFRRVGAEFGVPLFSITNGFHTLDLGPGEVAALSSR
jgi:hypothetical protein